MALFLALGRGLIGGFIRGTRGDGWFRLRGGGGAVMGGN